MTTIRLSLVIAIFCTFLGGFPPVVVAHDELTPQLIEQYKADGTLGDRQARIATLRQFRMDEGNLARALYRVRRAALEASGLTPADAARALLSGPSMAFPFTAQPELRSIGTVNTLTVLIDFKDHRAATVLPGLTTEGIRDNIYGTGTTAAQAFKPHESLHEYYRRASQDQVDVQGNVLGWHNFTKNRKEYEPAKAPAWLPPQQRQDQQALNDNRAIFQMLSEALDAFDATHDFGQYDNDNDGDIDLVTILYAGPDSGWGSFWWAYRWMFFTPEVFTKTFDGKRLRQFVFQFVDTRGSSQSDFDPTTLLHEMGHAFGLADYYDYDPNIGPQGGVGGLDMMHANQGNQNAFSRWLLDWIYPTVVGMGSPVVRTLTASGSPITTDKAVAIFPGLTGTMSPGQQMYIIENRHRVGNDELLPGDGLLIWHVDASVNPDGVDFEFDNSFTDRKLIRLVRADSPVDFAQGEHASPATYFTDGKMFTPDSTPNSRDYEGNDTRISVNEVAAAGETMTVRIGFLPSAPIPEPVLSAHRASPSTRPSIAAPLTVESVLASPVPLDLDTMEALDRQFSKATADTLAVQWKEANYEDTAPANPETRWAVLKLLLARWASKDGASAADAAMKLPASDRLRKEALPLVLDAWARNVPADAAKWYLDDRRKTLREGQGAVSARFVQQAFEGLYTCKPTEAVKGVEKLSSTAEVVNAVDGILQAGTRLGEKPDALSARLRDSKSDIVKARLGVIDALRDAEEKIKDPKQRKEFRKLMKQQPQRRD